MLLLSNLFEFSFGQGLQWANKWQELHTSQKNVGTYPTSASKLQLSSYFVATKELYR